MSFFLPSFYGGLVPSKLFFTYYWKTFSIASFEKTGYLTYTALALALLGLAKRFRSSRLWIGIMVVFGWLSLGPYLFVAGNQTGIPGIYLIYHSIPLFNVLREPGRFAVVFLIGFDIFAAYGYAAIEKWVNGPKRTSAGNIIAVMLISLLFLIETMGAPITNSGGIFPINTQPTIPSFYYAAANVPGNFSIMQLPALTDTYGLSNLYTGEADYYASASGKPLVGGYITRTNYTEYAYLYYIPLAIEAKNLHDLGSPYYPSPINENYTNQSLLVLYNFKTAFVVVNNQAYNNSQLYYIDSQLESIFGSPSYVSNSTVAFSTESAIQKSVFRSFVAYPVLQDWNFTPGSYLGIQNLWSPNLEGLVAVYAPYRNYSDQYNVEKQNGSRVNATLSFIAMSSNRDAELMIGEQQGLSSPFNIAALNLTPYPTEYRLKVTGLVSGELGNYLLFVPVNGASGHTGANGVYIVNITISSAN
jgi:hypothetical protein